MIASVWQRTGRQGQSARDMREIRRDSSNGLRSPNAMTARATVRHEHIATMSGGGVLRLRCRLPHGVHPLLEFLLRLGHDIKRHVRMLKPAEFGALSSKHAGRGDLRPDGGRVTRNQVSFA